MVEMLATRVTAFRTGDRAPASESATACLELDAVEKSFGAAGGEQTVALANISFSVKDGEFLSIVGPSGCGKSTLLQIAAGLVAPTKGRVLIDGRVVSGPPDSVVYLFQQYSRSLLPWRTALDNVAFAVEHRHANRTSARRHAATYLAMVGLAAFAGHYPRQLSGGMQQRVVIARALAAQPRVLLMDEPFSSVDALTRIELHTLILQLHETYRFTAVLVTHDVEEAIFLADRVAVLTARPGMLVRDIPTELPRPRDAIATRDADRFIALRHELLAMLLGRSR
jgi:NitT/TauT family transport system ATP-binding protein